MHVSYFGHCKFCLVSNKIKLSCPGPSADELLLTVVVGVHIQFPYRISNYTRSNYSVDTADNVLSEPSADILRSEAAVIYRSKDRGN